MVCIRKLRFKTRHYNISKAETGLGVGGADTTWTDTHLYQPSM